MKRSLLIPLISLLFLACAENPFKKQKPEVDEMTVEREKLKQSYSDRLKKAGEWKDGIPSADDCDGSLWAGVAAASGVPVKLDKFLYPGDKPQRRPGETCYPGDSRSSTSNDQLIGLGLGSYLSQQKSIIKRIESYGRDNDWIMGDPPTGIGEVLMKPNLRIVYQRSAGRSPKVPTFYTVVNKDFAYHTQVLLILWEGEESGKLSRNAVDRLKAASRAFPNDYLFEAAKGAYTGHMDRAILKLNQGIKPSSYVRGEEPERFALANWLLAARIALKYSR